MATHTRGRTLRALAAGIAATLAGAGAARAAVITQAAPFALSVANSTGSTGVPFLGFDASLGTLTEVDVTLSAVTIGGEEQELFVPVPGVLGGRSAGFSLYAQIIDPSGTVLAQAGGFASAGASCSTGSCIGSGPFVLQTALPTAAIALTGASALAGFETAAPELTAALGNGFDSVNFYNTTGLAYAGERGAPGFVATPHCFGELCAQRDTASFSGVLTVAYDYAPASVPEPAGAAILAAGLAGIAAARRRRRA